MNIYESIENIRGVGPKTLKELNKCGIFNIMDLLLYFPRGYKMANCIKDLDEAIDKQTIVLEGKVIEIKRDIRTRTHKILTTITFQNENGKKFKCRWFNQPYVKNKFFIGENYLLKGKVETYGKEKMLINPIVHYGEEDSSSDSIEAIYPLRGHVRNSTLVKLINSILNSVNIEENLPKWIIDEYRLCSLDSAIRNIHMPKNEAFLLESKKRLKFQELFAYSLKIMLLKELRNEQIRGLSFKECNELKDLIEKIPFELTAAQKKVAREVLIDEGKNIPMNRLVQGDVGSGKTIISILAIFNVVMNGYQGVLMAPTEILAQQHYEEFLELLKDFKLNIRLLSGSTPKKEKYNIKEELKRGKINIIIGTHALIEDDVEFKNLGIIVTDEQHRFGVMQRSKLFNKGENVDILVMTATPIPRTLSLYLYGDLDVSVIDELPLGRQIVSTYFISEKQKDRVYSFALKQIENGNQVYVVCPLVEENESLELNSVEKLQDELKNRYFNDIQVEILHGKMTPKEKNDIMMKFKNNEIKVLISTTVIEVGVNIPNATLMIIENAERFGLSQLHQLRGRVGRGKDKSYCVLLGNIKNEKTKKRMETLVNSNDGFYIAKEDLKIRGSGEIFGVKQHGEENLLLSDLIEDIQLLKQANFQAVRLINSSNSSDKEILNYLRDRIQNSKKFICFN